MIKKFLELFLIFLLGVFFAVIFTWPFITKLPTFYYNRGDYQLTGATLSYNEYAFRTGKIFDQKSYFQGFQFYPQPFTLVYSDLRLIPSLIYSPFFWLTHNFILSVNLTTFTTFVLTFIAGFYFLYYFTHHKLASIMGAMIYTFNPLTYSRFPEHFELLNKYFIPLVFLFAYKFFTLPNLKNSFLFGLLFTLNAFTAEYFQIFTIISIPIFVLPVIILKIKEIGIVFFGRMIKFSFIWLIFVPLFLYFDGGYLDFSRLEYSRRSITDNAFYSARLIDYFSANPQNWLYGSFIKSIEAFRAPQEPNSSFGIFNYREHTLFLNIIPSVLCIFSIVFLLKKYRAKKMNKHEIVLIVSFFLILITSFIFTFGPYFQGWNGNNGSFKLPFYYLYQLVPFIQGIRAPTRFLFIFYIPFSLFITIGLSQFLTFGKKRILLILGVLFIGVWVENITPQPIDTPYSDQSSITKELHQVELREGKLSMLAQKRTVHFPIMTPFNDAESMYLNWVAETHEIIVNGNRGSYIPESQANFLRQLDKKLGEETLKELYILNVDYIIFHKDLLGQNLGKYAQWLEYYQKSKIIDDDKVLIIDLKKYNFQFNECDFNKDIQVNIKIAKVKDFDQNFYAAILKNTADCFLPSIYLDKYRTMDLYLNFIKATAYLKLPVIIRPQEEIILSEITNDLRIN